MVQIGAGRGPSGELIGSRGSGGGAWTPPPSLTAEAARLCVSFCTKSGMGSLAPARGRGGAAGQFVEKSIHETVYQQGKG